MYTELDTIWPALLAIRTNINNVNQFFDIVVPTNTKTVRRIAIDNTIVLDDGDKESTPSTNEPRINRRIRNLNSNKSLERYGLVEPGYGEDGGWTLTPLGKTITKKECDELILNTNKYYYGYGTTPEPSIPTTTTVKSSGYPSSKPVRLAVRNRAEDTCECCGNNDMFLDRTGIPYLQAHHIYDKPSKNEKIMPRVRFDHYCYVSAICPNCHTNIHHGETGYLINQRLFAKISLIVELETNIANNTNINANKKLLEITKEQSCLNPVF